MKGRVAEYSSILNFESIDLSLDDLSGKIPNEETSLEELQALNLSHNCLKEKFLRMKVIWDRYNLFTSFRILYGEIPLSLAS